MVETQSRRLVPVSISVIVSLRMYLGVTSAGEMFGEMDKVV